MKCLNRKRRNEGDCTNSHDFATKLNRFRLVLRTFAGSEMSTVDGLLAGKAGMGEESGLPTPAPVGSQTR